MSGSVGTLQVRRRSSRILHLPAAAIALLLLVILLASQALAFGARPTGDVDTAGALGRTGFAYLGGVRKFAAAVLWNRIEPVFHAYYGGVPLVEQRYMVPSLYLITVLDPQFTQAYYLSSFMVGELVSRDEGIKVAREGARNNPDSGMMHANLAQMLYVRDKRAHQVEILREIDLTLAEGRSWIDDDERYEGYVMCARMLETLGQPERASRIDAVLERMKTAGIGAGDHDHDQDGEQDH